MKRKLQETFDDEPCPSASSHARIREVLQKSVRRQLHEVADDQPQCSKRDLHSNNCLKRMWAESNIAFLAVQELSCTVGQQGAMGAEGFAKIGASGVHRGNLFRDLCQAIGVPIGSLAVKWFRIPTEQDSCLFPVLCPHELFKHLHRDKKDLFMSALLGGAENDLAEFWDSTTGKKLARDHPILRGRRRRQLLKTILVGVHGDAGEFSHQDSVNVISWSSIVGLGDTKSRSMIFAVIRKSQLRSDGAAWDALWKIFGWSMNTLLTGKDPEQDWQGKPTEGDCVHLADGWSAALLQVRGDWSFFPKSCTFRGKTK